MVDRKTFKMFEKFDKFDNELLISLVKVRPALWDRTLVRSHKDMIQRASAWREICKVMCPEYDNFTKTEKHLYTKTIIKKWTNIRDAWKKSYIQTRMKKKYTPYVYHDHLKFLEKNLQFQKKFSQDDASGAESDPVAVPVTVPVTVPVQKTEIVYPSDSDNTSDAQYARPPSDVDSSSVGKRMTEMEEEHEVDPNIRVIDVKSLIGQAQDNPHVCFTRSLLPTLNKLTDDEVLEFQLGVVQLLQNIRRKRPRVTGEAFPNYGFPS